MADQQQVAQPVNFRISAKNIESLIHVACREGFGYLFEHVFEQAGHLGQLP